ncbi:hypothetical protein SDRG_17041 [Saprolegnia diclina VS20]|uniref:Uncharacterized protein n=1 Tax=Saprolegnia diclina (strain VS20) TaxID=1156394 RepID=T0QZ99_SAPDV|nr:hypothetical protein SDRG_17041 [Saprolegnia diclina VS20]EQC25078.1 hypothetical protein SDRG_17041 [Saprolegnia diclina VS20]|eukprot:XP_008621495.1 hypothetical protein SDRG_17041 [Saprolegnia diclina VS20]
MRRVAYPDVLVNWSRSLTARFRADMGTASPAAIDLFNRLNDAVQLTQAPRAWGVANYLGGDFTCPTQNAVPFVGIYFSNQGACATNMEDTILVTAMASSVALLAAGPQVDLLDTCAHATMQVSKPCLRAFTATRTFLDER